MEKIVTHHRSEGFALIGALALVAILSISAAPLLQRTAGVDKELLKQTSQKLVAINARESLETTVQLLRRNGIDPDFLNSVGSPTSIRLANTCNRRIVAADPSLLNGQALSDITTKHTSITKVRGAETTSFLLTISSASDNRFDKILAVGCSVNEIGAIGLYVSELASIKGSILPVSFNEY